MVRNGAATFPETGLFAPLSPFYNNGWFVREISHTKKKEGVFVYDHAGLVLKNF